MLAVSASCDTHQAVIFSHLSFGLKETCSQWQKHPEREAFFLCSLFDPTHRVDFARQQQQQGALSNPVRSNDTNWRRTGGVSAASSSLPTTPTQVDTPQPDTCTLTPRLHVNAKVHVFEKSLLGVVAKVNTCTHTTDLREDDGFDVGSFDVGSFDVSDYTAAAQLTGLLGDVEAIP